MSQSKLSPETKAAVKEADEIRKSLSAPSKKEEKKAAEKTEDKPASAEPTTKGISDGVKGSTLTAKAPKNDK